MELKITRFCNDADASAFSGSVAERGPNAGPETWANANAEAAERPLLATDAEVDKARDYFKEFGAWDDAERAAWSATEVNALLLQDISGTLREAQACCPGDGPGGIDWAAHAEAAQVGQISGLLSSSGSDVFFYMGH